MRHPSVRFVVPLLALGAGIAGCDGSGPDRSPTTLPSGTTVEASPATEPSPQSDEAAVEEVVRTYLAALERDDYPGKVMTTTGDLQAAADWEDMVSVSFGDALATVDIGRLEVVDVGPDAATVDLDAELRLAGFESDPPTVLSGPVRLVRQADGWKINDLVQDGRSRADGIFTSVDGTQVGDGITVGVYGVDIRTNSILLVLEATNATGEPLTLEPATIMGDDGQELGFGEPSATQRAALPSAVLDTYLYWSGRSLPEGTTSFRLLLEFAASDGSSAVALDIPVSLGS